MDKEEYIKNSKYAQKAMSLFREGYNCSQSVFLAFSDRYHLDRETALAISSSFGGGMGRLREVCGTVSGMFMTAGVLYGYTSSTDTEAKGKHYERIQELAKQFESFNHSIICRELLGLDRKRDNAVPSERTEEYYHKRPCVELVGIAAAIMEEYIKKQEESQ